MSTGIHYIAMSHILSNGNKKKFDMPQYSYKLYYLHYSGYSFTKH